MWRSSWRTVSDQDRPYRPGTSCACSTVRDRSVRRFPTAAHPRTDHAATPDWCPTAAPPQRLTRRLLRYRCRHRPSVRHRAVTVLAPLAPTLAEAMRNGYGQDLRRPRRHPAAHRPGAPPGRRPGDVAADRLCCSGKHKRHRMNVQVLADPSGKLIRASPALPGVVHDLRSARAHWGSLPPGTPSMPQPRPTRPAGWARATEEPSGCPTGGTGESSRPDSRPTTAPTPAPAYSVSRRLPPSSPGGCCAAGEALRAARSPGLVCTGEPEAYVPGRCLRSAPGWSHLGTQ